MAEVAPFLPKLLEGLLTTLQVYGLSLLAGAFWAFLLGIGRQSELRAVRWVSGAVIEIFRGTSSIVQLFYVFYAVPLLLGMDSMPSMVAAVLVLGLNVGSFSAIVRGAMAAVPQGQADAAIALNWSRSQRIRKVILPQAVSAMVPQLANMAIDTLKATSMVGFVLVQDLTYWTQQTVKAVGNAGLLLGGLLVTYYLLSLVISGIFRWLESITPLARADAEREARRLRNAATHVPGAPGGLP